ncbi:MAG: DUF2058 family protein [Steroidobacteraceae bacterium]
MSMSLRDQLLAAGLGSKQQAKKAREEQHQRARGKQPAQSEAALAAQRAQAQKIAWDRELSLKAQAKAEAKAKAKALRAQIRECVEQAKLPRIEGDDLFSFVDEGRIRRVPVDAARRAQLVAGEVLIVRSSGAYEMLPATSPMLARIRELDPRVIMPAGGTVSSETVDENDPYKDYKVPDDLVW